MRMRVPCNWPRFNTATRSYTAYFFYGVGLLSGATMDQCKEEVAHKFVPT
jgi:hypothetical protein